jgi:hypothetical protein
MGGQLLGAGGQHLGVGRRAGAGGQAWAARPWSSATTAASLAGVSAEWLVEWVFESMAATSQPHQNTSTKPKMWITLPSPTHQIQQEGKHRQP